MNISLLAFNVEYIQYKIWKINLKFIHILVISLVLGAMGTSSQASFIWPNAC
jgi:hypothetical protein